jgi:acyl carrier protein
VSAVDAQRREILAQVAEVVRDVIGEEWAHEVSIELETTFADLELESIEIVALGEQLQERYASVDFAGWLGGMDLDEIIGLTVGRLVDYIAECQ